MKKLILATVILLMITVSSIAQEANYPEFVSITGGTYSMGDEHDNGTKDEQPTHEVIVSDFSIGKTEVTVVQYRTFCMATETHMPAEPSWGWQDNAPIVNVSWYDGIKYCEWLTEKLNKKITLPTEAQWEYAARGGNKSQGYVFSGDNGEEDISLYWSFWDFSTGWYTENSDNKSHSVASKEANELGLFDMSGNVWEWCLDFYSHDFYINSTDKNPINNTGGYRILRGGAWNSPTQKCRVAERESGDGGGKSEFIGFRVVSN